MSDLTTANGLAVASNSVMYLTPSPRLNDRRLPFSRPRWLDIDEFTPASVLMFVILRVAKRGTLPPLVAG